MSLGFVDDVSAMTPCSVILRETLRKNRSKFLGDVAASAAFHSCEGVLTAFSRLVTESRRRSPFIFMSARPAAAMHDPSNCPGRRPIKH